MTKDFIEDLKLNHEEEKAILSGLNPMKAGNSVTKMYFALTLNRKKNHFSQ